MQRGNNMNKLQNESFKSATEAGSADRLTGDSKIYCTANPGTGALNKTLYDAVVAGDLGSASVSPVISNAVLNTYDMTSTLTNSIIRHTAKSGVMYQLPTAVVGKKFFFTNECVNPSGATVLTITLNFNSGIIEN